MKKFKMIDTHTHYAHPKFDDTREELLETFPEQGIITVIEAAIGYESNFAILLTKNYKLYVQRTSKRTLCPCAG